MEIKIEIPDFDKNSGIKYTWENGFAIDVQYDRVVRIAANKEGLRSLANHLLNLA